jgi:segregation and condensation protein B
VSQVSAALEAILFSSNRPLKIRELQQATDSDRNAVEGALEELRESLEGRGVMLMRHHDEIHLATRPEYAPAVRRALRPEVSGRLSQAAYETLAIVAYQQPVTRASIEEVRGVNCDSVLGNLELRDLITEVGRGSGPGQPKLYGTTMRFLQVMGLESLDRLPTPTDGVGLVERAGVASRRAADELIASGAVRVNGQVATTGMVIDPANDRVTVDGRPVRPPTTHRYLMLNKPLGVITTSRDE